MASAQTVTVKLKIRNLFYTKMFSNKSVILLLLVQLKLNNHYRINI